MNLKFNSITALGLMAAMPALASVPTPPANLQADIQGHQVTLTWENSDSGELIHSNSFEGDSFPGEGWEVRTTDTADPCFTWFQYPAEQYLEWENWQSMIHSGEKSAYLNFDLFIPRPEGSEISAHQDEWLISPVMDNAAYVSFWFVINSSLLTNGAFDEFPNDFFVKVSHDGGETWEDVWNARYDMMPIDTYQQAIVCLGEPTDNMRVAFVGVSDPDIFDYGLYYSWALDDVEFYSSLPAAQAPAAAPASLPAFRTYHEFDTTGLVASRPAGISAPARMPQAYYYNIYRNGELIATNLHTLAYTDVEPKDDGDYLYSVVAVGMDGESEPANITINIGDATFMPPRNLQLRWEYNEDTRFYTVFGTWDDPDTTFHPASYNMYFEGQKSATIDYGWEREFGISEIPAGTYRFDLEAVYMDPEGTSALLTEWITIGGRSTVTGIRASVEGNDVHLDWGEPTEPDRNDLESYMVYRSDKLIADNMTENSFVDTDVENGLRRYTVYCRYNDGSMSEEKHIDVKIGEMPAHSLPAHEGFNTGIIPDDWSTATNFDQTPETYLFRFENPFGLEIDGEGFDGGFASADNVAAGFYLVAAFLTSPVYDLSDITDRSALTLEFAYDFLGTGNSRVTVEYSCDRGETWNIIDPEKGSLPWYTEQDLAEMGAYCNPKIFSENFSSIATGETIMFRLYFESYWDHHIAVDNWKVFDANGSSVGEIAAASDVKMTLDGNLLSLASASAITAVEAWNTAGERVARISATGNNASVELPAGVCIVKVTTAEGAVTKKFIVK